MSFTIYVANEGGKDNPISPEAWMDASKRCGALTTRHYTKRNGQQVYEVFLPGKRNRYIWLNPYGVIGTQGPNEEIIHVMFELAKYLNANVYNENFKKYSSFEDWERKTRHERKRAAIEEEKERRRNRIRLALWSLLIACSAIIGWFLKDILNLLRAS